MSCTILVGTRKCARAWASENMVDVESRARFASIIALHLRLIDRARSRPSAVITMGPKRVTPVPGVVHGSMNHNIRIKRLTTNRRRNTSLIER